MRSTEIADRLTDILENIQRIDRHVGSMTRTEFLDDDLVSDAVERCLSRISEAAVRLGAHAEKVVPGHSWPDIRGLGNVLRHAYHRVEVDVVWDIVVTELPTLKQDVTAALARLEPPSV